MVTCTKRVETQGLRLRSTRREHHFDVSVARIRLPWLKLKAAARKQVVRRDQRGRENSWLVMGSLPVIVLF